MAFLPNPASSLSNLAPCEPVEFSGEVSNFKRGCDLSWGVNASTSSLALIFPASGCYFYGWRWKQVRRNDGFVTTKTIKYCQWNKKVKQLNLFFFGGKEQTWYFGAFTRCSAVAFLTFLFSVNKVFIYLIYFGKNWFIVNAFRRMITGQ